MKEKTVAPSPDWTTERQKAAEWARDLLTRPFVILDTETTGLNRHRADEPVQIALIDQKANVLLDTLVKPTIALDPNAVKIHGITEALLTNAPSYAQLYRK